MRNLAVFLLVLVFAAGAFAGDVKCKECGVKFLRQDAVRFGSLSFCSEACKSTFAEDDRELGECEGCGVEVKGDHREFVSGNTRYIKLGQRPDWDGLCNACRADQKSGEELGTTRAAINDRADRNEWDEDHPREAAPRKKNKRQLDAEAEDGYGVMTYVLATVGVLFALFKFFLK